MDFPKASCELSRVSALLVPKLKAAVDTGKGGDEAMTSSG
jgi:hypothetical protein